MWTKYLKLQYATYNNINIMNKTFCNNITSIKNYRISTTKMFGYMYIFFLISEITAVRKPPTIKNYI